MCQMSCKNLLRNGPLSNFFKNVRVFRAPKTIDLRKVPFSNKPNLNIKDRLGKLISIAKLEHVKGAEIPHKKLTHIILIIFGLSCFGFSIKKLGSPYHGSDGRPKLDKFSNFPLFLQYTLRAVHEIKYYVTIFTSSTSGKLLPDVTKTGLNSRKYTLIIEFTDVLVHPDWNPNQGRGFKKRPGIDHFLDTVAKSYEIVIYTAEPAITVFPILKAMDPNNLVSYKLVKNSTIFEDGQRIKDLDNINRELNRVIVVDWNYNCTKYHPENVLTIPRWKGNDDDMSLIYLSQFLLAIADNGIEDVREVIKYYNKFDDPLKVFLEKQTRLVDIAEANADKYKCSEAKVKRWTVLT